MEEDYVDLGLRNMLQRLISFRIADNYPIKRYNKPNNIDGVIKLYTDDGVAIRKLFIGNIAQRTTHKDIEKVFSSYGPLECCYVKKQSGRSNFAFVTFKSMHDAHKAVKDGYQRKIHLHNRNLRVMPADPWHQPDSIEFQTKKNPAKFSDDDTQFELNDDADIDKLNNDCLIRIFSFLPIIDRINMEKVCKRWKYLSRLSWRSFTKLDLKNSTWGLNNRSSGFERASTNLIWEIDTPLLRKVLIRCGIFLTHIDFNFCTDKLSVSTLTIVGKMCPNLQSINVTCLNVTPSGIKSLAENCKDIEMFSLGCCSISCDNELSQLFKNNQKLKCLTITQNTMTGKCLLNLPADSIQSITLTECFNISPCHFANAIVKLRKLHSLMVTKCITFNEQVVKIIGTCSDNLKFLNFCNYFPMVRKSDMFHLANLVHLETLELSTNESVDDDFLIAIGIQCINLTTINISSCNCITNRGLAAITLLPNLQHLYINYLRVITDKVLTSMLKIRKLECRGCPNIQSEGLCSLLELAQDLELLDLSGCSKISNELIEAAISLTTNRSNNVLLKLYVGGTSSNTKLITKISPLLQVLNVDLSETYLKPDFKHGLPFWNVFEENNVPNIYNHIQHDDVYDDHLQRDDVYDDHIQRDDIYLQPFNEFFD